MGALNRGSTSYIRIEVALHGRTRYECRGEPASGSSQRVDIVQCEPPRLASLAAQSSAAMGLQRSPEYIGLDEFQAPFLLPRLTACS